MESGSQLGQGSQPGSGSGPRGRPGSGDSDGNGNGNGSPDPTERTGPAPAEYRVDELARLANTTVRNVRAYQDRGLLPAPRRQGRVGLYSETHLARLRLIGSLLDRGYTLANIAELVSAWEQGHQLADLLGFEVALVTPWSQEAPTVVSVDELFELVGNPSIELAAKALEQAIELGIVEPEADGDGFVVVSPGTLEAGSVLIRAGVPFEAVLALTRRMHHDLDDVARLFVELIETQVIDPLGDPLPFGDIPRISELVERLRPLAKLVVDAELSRAMDRHIGERLGDRIARILSALPADAS